MNVYLGLLDKLRNVVVEVDACPMLVKGEVRRVAYVRIEERHGSSVTFRILAEDVKLFQEAITKEATSMRVNVYSEELTGEHQIIWRTIRETGKRYCGVRFLLKSPNELHNTPEDDDRSAVTFWFESIEEAHDTFQKVIERCCMPGLRGL